MYQHDPQAAAEADNIGMYLTDSGKYIGKFTRAEKLQSPRTGAHGVGFTFEANGQSCRFDLWTMKADQSEKYGGYRQLQAIMTCMGLTNLNNIQTGQVERYNFNTRQQEKVQAPIFPDLLGKPIGLVLQKREYKKYQDGYETDETAWRLEFFQAFRAGDGFTASEITARALESKKLAKTLETLKDRPLDGKAPAAPRATPPAPAPASAGFDDDDDQIPF